MKKLLLLTIIPLIFASCHKADTEIPFDLDCNHTQELRDEYLLDAAKVYERYIYKNELIDTLEIYFNTYEVERRLCELIAIKNWSHPLSDTLFNRLDIHASTNDSDLRCLTLSIPESSLPDRDWEQNKTGDTEIDALISQYNLQASLIENKDGVLNFFLCSDDFLNTKPLSDLFKERTIISNINPTILPNKPINIEIVSFQEDYVDYIFRRNWTRDFTDYTRTWKIRVYEDYDVLFRESTGDSLP